MSGSLDRGEPALGKAPASSSVSATRTDAAYASMPSRPTEGLRPSINDADQGSRRATATDTGQSEGELWSNILNSVTSSRVTPVKNMIVLGQARTGKSTLIASLASHSPSGFVTDPLEQDGTPEAPNGAVLSSNQHEIPRTVQKSVSSDLGLGYGYFDVGDDDGEDVVARVGIYQVNSSHPATLSLMPFALSDGGASEFSGDAHPARKSGSTGHATAKAVGEPSARDDDKCNTRTSGKLNIDAFCNTLFMIVLDWEAPWTFLSQLIEWLDVIRDAVEQAASVDEGDQGADDIQTGSSRKLVLGELKERLRAYVRNYTEPAVIVDNHGPAPGDAILEDVEGEVGETSMASAIVAVSNPTGVEDDERVPLPQGCLTHNLGVPIVVVCTKADTIAQLERQRNFKEEQFDYIQQVLRTICLSYGAGLFFTAQSRPHSFDVVRQYLLHRLFSSARHHSATGAFHFRHRASTVERDVLLVPAGWDSYGKIRALREGYDCASMASGWEWDARVERIRRLRGLPKGAREAEEEAERQLGRRSASSTSDVGAGAVSSAVRLYEDIVEDWDASVRTNAAGNARVREPEEQAFLKQQYTLLQHEPDTRTRGAVARGAAPGAGPAAAGVADGESPDGGSRGVVGPLGSTSLSLPSVERAMQERHLISDESRSGGAAGPGRGPSRRDSAFRVADIGRSETTGGTPSGRSTPTAMHRTSAGGMPTPSAMQSPSLSSSERGGSRPTSPLGPGAGIGASLGTPKQSEVLHSFFQSLLKEKPASGGGAGVSAAGTRPSQPGGRSANSAQGGASRTS